MNKLERTKALVERLLSESPDGLDWATTRAHAARLNGESERQANRTLASATDALDLEGVASVDAIKNRIVLGSAFPSPSAEVLSAQILRDFAGQCVTRRQIVQHYLVSYPSAARALARMGRQGMASSRRVGSVSGWLVHPPA